MSAFFLVCLLFSCMCIVFFVFLYVYCSFVYVSERESVCEYKASYLC